MTSPAEPTSKEVFAGCLDDYDIHPSKIVQRNGCLVAYITVAEANTVVKATDRDRRYVIRGCFIVQEDVEIPDTDIRIPVWVAIDNQSGDAFTESFFHESAAISWLVRSEAPTDEQHVRDIRRFTRRIDGIVPYGDPRRGAFVSWLGRIESAYGVSGGVRMRQCTLSEFSPRIIPAEGWKHEHTDGRAWIYRTNAEAVVKDIGRMPSGAGLWPRIMPTRRRGAWESWDLHAWQCRGPGPFTKLINTDGALFDEFRPYRTECVNGKPTERSMTRLEAVSAYIDGDLLITETRDGGQWSVDIVEDSECEPHDIHPFDPVNVPEHFLILCLSRGITGKELMDLTDMPV